MALSESITFIVSDNSVNKFGGRVLTSGISLEEFQKNPVMLYGHFRDDGFFQDKPQNLPIGRWENLRIEGEQLKADARFDLDDEFAAEIHRKVQERIINAASIGIEPLAFSEDPEDLLPGQTRATITKSKLLEISVVDIPANDNAMQLNMSAGLLCFSGAQDIYNLNKIYPEMENNTENNKPEGEKMTIAEQLSAAFEKFAAGFMAKLNANYTLSKKEGVENPATVEEITAEIKTDLETFSFKVEAPAENTQLAELSEKFEQFTAAAAEKEKQFEQLKAEMLELKGKGSTQAPANDKSPVGTKENNSAATGNRELAGVGSILKNQMNKRD